MIADSITELERQDLHKSRYEYPTEDHRQKGDKSYENAFETDTQKYQDNKRTNDRKIVKTLAKRACDTYIQGSGIEPAGYW